MPGFALGAGTTVSDKTDNPKPFCLPGAEGCVGGGQEDKPEDWHPAILADDGNPGLVLRL